MGTPPTTYYNYTSGGGQRYIITNRYTWDGRYKKYTVAEARRLQASGAATSDEIGSYFTGIAPGQVPGQGGAMSQEARDQAAINRAIKAGQLGNDKTSPNIFQRIGNLFRRSPSPSPSPSPSLPSPSPSPSPSLLPHQVLVHLLPFSKKYQYQSSRKRARWKS